MYECNVISNMNLSFSNNDRSDSESSEKIEAEIRRLGDEQKEASGAGSSESENCELCHLMEPPVSKTESIQWTECPKCGAWFHNDCMNIKNITAKFSCRSLRRKCNEKK